MTDLPDGPIANPADDPDHEPDLGPEGDDETAEEE